MPRDNSPVLSTPTSTEMALTNEDAEFRRLLAERMEADELEPLEESPALNRLLLRNARKSLKEISEITGIDVREVSERLSILVDNRSWRDDLMEEKLLLAELAMLIEDIRERMSRFNVEDDGWAKMAQVQLQTIKTFLEQIDKRRKAINNQLKVITQAQAELMAAAIRLATERAVFRLEQQFPELDPEVIYVAFDESMEEAVTMLKKKAGNA